MELELFGMPKLAKIQYTIVECNNLLGGIQFVVSFPNGYGASIVRHSGSYGVELAVLNSRGDITYDTPITEFGILGYLTPETLVAAMQKIAAL